VKREITAGLLREIESRKVMILPIVIDDSKLPLLVRDKRYADFRGGFEEGLSGILSVLIPHYQTQSLGRVSPHDSYYIDYSCRTEIVEGQLICEIDIISFDLEETYSILSQLRFEAAQAVTLESLDVQTVDEVTDLILNACISEFAKRPARVAVSPGKKTASGFSLLDEEGSVLFDASSTVSVVGDMRKGAVVFNVGALFTQIDGSRRSAEKQTDAA
jgi:hypothetical protein